MATEHTREPWPWICACPVQGSLSEHHLCEAALQLLLCFLPSPLVTLLLCAFPACLLPQHLLSSAAAGKASTATKLGGFPCQ